MTKKLSNNWEGNEDEPKRKNEMKQYIGQFLDIAGGRYTDEEVEALYDAVENREFYNGRSYSAGPRSHDS